MADPQVVVPVKSAWLSKINWTQAVASIAMVLALVTGNAISLTADQQGAVVVVIGVIGNIATFIFKTWFTKSVTPSSAAK
jgi:hypothetical protein